MGFLDRFFKKKPELSDRLVRLTEDEVRAAVKQAHWDLFVSNLPDPVVVDTQVNTKETPEIYADGVPRGFSIDPDTWVTYFCNDDMPDFLSREKLFEHARSVGQHETMHFTRCPGSKRTHVGLIDGGLKGLHKQESKGKTGADIAHLVTNIFADWSNDYGVGVEKYGREDFSQITRDRIRDTVKSVAEKNKENLSPLWKVLVGTYEKMFDENFGLEDYVKLDSYEERIIETCVEIMGNDHRDRTTWPVKVRKLAGVLEEVIYKSAQEQQGKGKGKKGDGQGGQSGGGISIPQDVEDQMGEGATESPYTPTEEKGGKQGKGKKVGKPREGKEGKGIDDDVLDEVFKLNRNNPGQFAGTLSAVEPIEANDAIRYMYRARAQEYLVEIHETKESGSYTTPSSLENWDVGDPLMGKGGLLIVPALLTHGVVIPGINTVKRGYEIDDLPGHLVQIADILWIVDSSGSLDWNPMENHEEARGGFDKVILAAEAGTLYSRNHGGKAAAMNFSGIDDRTKQRQVKIQGFTDNLDDLEKVIMHYYGGGTIFPVEELDRIYDSNQNRIVTCIVSDFHISNSEDTKKVIRRRANSQNPIYALDIGGTSNFFEDMKDIEGLYREVVTSLNSLKGVAIGKLKKDYER
ncbi:MAG: hypothetical protein ABIE22_05525 [archaeon]